MSFFAHSTAQLARFFPRVRNRLLWHHDSCHSDLEQTLGALRAARKSVHVHRRSSQRHAIETGVVDGIHLGMNDVLVLEIPIG